MGFTKTCAAVLIASMATAYPLQAQAPDSAFAKQILRLQYTEFCSVVGKPPVALAEAINGAIEHDPMTWVPIAAWWNKIKDHYDNKAKCGDA